MSTKPAIDFPYPIEFLARQTLADVADELVDPSRIIDIHETETVETALQTMYRHSVSSLAVYRMVQSTSPVAKYEESRREYYSFLTMADIAHYLIFQTDVEKLKDAAEQHQGPEITIHAIKTPVMNVRGTNRESTKFVILPSRTSLFEAIKTMRSKAVHHIFVIHPNDDKHRTADDRFVKPTDHTKSPVVIGQSDIVQFLSKRTEHMGKILSMQTADALMLLSLKFSESYDPNQPVHLAESRWTGSRMKYAIHQPEHYSAFTCFKTMLIHHMSAIAIVDDNGRLVENLSMTDFANISESKLGMLMLFKPVIEFLHELLEARRPLATVKRTAVLSEILENMSTNEVHHVWVVENQKPVGCVSMSDILAGLIPLEGLSTVQSSKIEE